MHGSNPAAAPQLFRAQHPNPDRKRRIAGLGSMEPEAMSEAPQRHHLIRTCVRGLQNRCPNCGQRTLFEEGRFFRVAHTCRNCDLPIDRGGGFFLGPVALNYGFVAFGIVGPLILLGVMGIVPVDAAVVIGVIGALLFPILLYRFS